MDIRETLKDKKKIVIKIGTSTVTHAETGNIDLDKLEKFVRILTNLINKGKEVVVVSSGAVGIGRNILGFKERPAQKEIIQACAAVGQGKLIMMYEKLFAEYGYITAQVLLTKESITNDLCASNAKNTFNQLSAMKVIPIVNENDAISVDEGAYGNFGDNDTMAAQVAALIGADLLIMMSDINGLYTDDPKINPSARFVHTVSDIDEGLVSMGGGACSSVGTGGMATKIRAAQIATDSGADMVIANGKSIYTINDIMAGKKIGTLFLSKNSDYEGGNELAPIKDIYRKHKEKVNKGQKGGNKNELHAVNW
ncbi:MAG: glutamate 5-kinase [Suipraeoptans sp.]